MSIEFTQYLRPNGKKQTIVIDRPSEIEELASQIKEKGFVFECEELTTGAVSLTIFDNDTEEDVAIELVKNGPAVLTAVDRLISAFVKTDEFKKARKPEQ